MRDLGQLILVHLVEKRPAGDIFPRKRADWPLHITLVPWFHIAKENEGALLDALRRYGQGRAPFSARVGAEAMFGPAHGIPVNVLADQSEIKRLHDDVLAIAKACGATWRGAASPHSGRGQAYLAHITHHVKDGQIHRRHTGDEVVVGDCTVARLSDDSGSQVVEIVENIAFGGGV